MKDDEQYEAFDFNSSDYEFAMQRGTHRRQTKEQQIYGILGTGNNRRNNTQDALALGVFADSDDDGKPSFSGGKAKASYNTPVSFVSGGIKKGSKTEVMNTIEPGLWTRL
jgi:Tuftelin interacting protein N terminal